MQKAGIGTHGTGTRATETALLKHVLLKHAILGHLCCFVIVKMRKIVMCAVFASCWTCCDALTTCWYTGY